MTCKRLLPPLLQAGGAAVLLLLAGCSRKNNPLLSTPSGVSSVSLEIPQIDSSKAPENRVFLSVRDGSSNPLTSFKLGDFSLLENGRPGVPAEAGLVTDTLYVVLVMDRSGSMAASAGGGLTRNQAANTAAVNLVNALGATDQMALVEFDSTVKLTVDFTSDKNALITAINAGTPGSATALYDGVFTGAGVLNRRAGRRLLLAMSDGADNSSSHSLQETIEHVNRIGVSAYTVSLGDDLNAGDLQNYRMLAESTNGQTFSSSDGTNLSSIFLNILNKMADLVYVKYRKRSESGTLTVYLNYGALTASATRRY